MSCLTLIGRWRCVGHALVILTGGSILGSVISGCATILGGDFERQSLAVEDDDATETEDAADDDDFDDAANDPDDDTPADDDPPDNDPPDDDLVEEDSGASVECEPGTSRCSGDETEICGIDGFYDIIDCAELGETCGVMDGVSQCIAEPCHLAEQARCVGRFLQVCNVESLQWEIHRTCQSVGECSTTARDCTSECRDGDVQCSDNDLYRCSDESWDLVTTCGLSRLCDAEAASADGGAEACRPCTPGGGHCLDRHLYRCDGEIFNYEATCDSAADCEPDGCAGAGP